jgi:CheY-like chemotaxis protein
MKVLLVDDHALFREGVRLLLERLGDEFEILEAGDCAAALELAEKTPELGLVLLDLALPDKPGFEALTIMRERYPGVPVVVSGSEDRPSVIEAINRGAMGYIPKSSNSTLLMSALELVFAKGVYIPPSVLTDRANMACLLSVIGCRFGFVALEVDHHETNYSLCRETIILDRSLCLSNRWTMRRGPESQYPRGFRGDGAVRRGAPRVERKY